MVADTRAATLRLATHLAELGHRRIVHLAGSPLSWQSEQRLLGIEDARALGVEVTVVRSGAIRYDWEFPAALTYRASR